MNQSLPYLATNLKERARHHSRNLVMTMSFVGGCAIAAFTPQRGYGDDWLGPVLIAICFGVPGGLILYPAYRFLRFALRR